MSSKVIVEKSCLLKRSTTPEEGLLLSPRLYDFPEYSMAPLTRSRSRCTSVVFEQDKDTMTVWINSLSSQEIGHLLEGLVQRCSISQLTFLWTSLESVPHKEFLYHLKRLFPSTSFPSISTPVSRELKEKFKRSRRQENKTLYRTQSTLLNDDITSSLSTQLLSPQATPLPDIRPYTAPEYTQRKSPGYRLCTSSRRHMTVTLSPTTTPTHYLTTPLQSYRHPHSSTTLPSPSPSLTIYSTNTTTVLNDDRRLTREFYDWFTALDKDWKQKEVLQLIVWSLEERELFYLSTLLLSRQYRDYITDLPETIVRRILSYVPGKDILTACRVSQCWNERCSCNMLWKIKCSQISLGVPCLPSLTWKQIYINDIKLRRRWRLGRCVKHTLTGHTHRVLCVRVKERESVMASGSSDQTIRIWSLKDGGKLLNTIYTHSRNIWCLCFYGLNFLLSGSGDGSIRIWNYKTGTCQRCLSGHTGTVWSISRKCDILISGAHDNTAILWNIRHCQYITHLRGHTGVVFSVDLNDTATEAYTASGDKTVRVWSVTDGTCMRSFSISKHHPVISLHYSEGLLACSTGSVVSLWNIAKGEKLKEFKGHEGRVESVHLLTSGSNSDTLISGGRDGIVKYWNINSGRCIRTLLSQPTTIINDIHRDSMYLVLGSDDYTIQVLSFNPISLPLPSSSPIIRLSTGTSSTSSTIQQRTLYGTTTSTSTGTRRIGTAVDRTRYSKETRFDVTSSSTSNSDSSWRRRRIKSSKV